MYEEEHGLNKFACLREIIVTKSEHFMKFLRRMKFGKV